MVKRTRIASLVTSHYDEMWSSPCWRLPGDHHHLKCDAVCSFRSVLKFQRKFLSPWSGGLRLRHQTHVIELLRNFGTILPDYTALRCNHIESWYSPSVFWYYIMRITVESARCHNGFVSAAYSFKRMRQAERTKHCFLSKATASGGFKEMTQKLSVRK
jgi:hypothetical protein